MPGGLQINEPRVAKPPKDPLAYLHMLTDLELLDWIKAQPCKRVPTLREAEKIVAGRKKA